MAADELAGAVAEGVGTSGDGESGEMPADVLGELFRRNVAARCFFAQGFQNDVVEVAAQLATQTGRRCRTPLRDAFTGRRPHRSFFLVDPGIGAWRRTWPRRFRLADDTRGFVERQGRHCERPTTAEQLVQQHPQRIDVGRRGDRQTAQLLRAGVVGCE